ncbi:MULTISPECIES: tripartite tricarboxylate transporter substrate binding protein [unclassified Modicisalibacter]|uniref:Bug family tripartite tricarboxylate transporter substrate binding protein n=1 Tax=unclassified Modicisalibacter TaxID=2679913 RepID=UPI001CCB7680|nr:MULTISPECIES: tripartite tricarboxylate transporter substrate binding protein [unclassified Modicisalibacter]MBZ9558623.1 tripartite tricarboxylate transporter substrate binding protein [Modicisalibacter sp. R2A 31.J]MBZ9575485.1 tripartite tricarboxylate transporter substrate binding protein [Modicisalibacter sp. MOD 31.J]
MRFVRRSLLLSLLVGASHSAIAKDTMDIIVPFAAGGATDIVARSFEPGFSKQLGVTSVVRNIAGASATVGTAEVAKSQGNPNIVGYEPAGALSIQPSLKKLPYDTDSFTYVCRTTSNPMFLLVSKSSDIHSFEELVTASRQQPLLYGSSGPGTLPQLAVAALVGESDLQASHVPYSGTGPAMNALAGNEIQIFADTEIVLSNYDLRPLAVFADHRLEGYDDVPTIGELGLPALSFSVWQGVVAPKGISQQRADQLSEACKATVTSDRFKSFAKKANVDIAYLGPRDFESFVKQRFEANKKVLKDAGLTE